MSEKALAHLSYIWSARSHVQRTTFEPFPMTHFFVWYQAVCTRRWWVVVRRKKCPWVRFVRRPRHKKGRRAMPATHHSECEVLLSLSCESLDLLTKWSSCHTQHNWPGNTHWLCLLRCDFVVLLSNVLHQWILRGLMKTHSGYIYSPAT